MVGAICHGPWVLCSTQALKGRRATCFFAIKDDVSNAGARYVDMEVVRDGNIITSRKPDDLPRIQLQTILQAVKETKPALVGKTHDNRQLSFSRDAPRLCNRPILEPSFRERNPVVDIGQLESAPNRRNRDCCIQL